MCSEGSHSPFISLLPLFVFSVSQHRRHSCSLRFHLRCGPTGAGHFVKMVHNGIEYGMMQAYGEGFEILEASDYATSFNYAQQEAEAFSKG